MILEMAYESVRYLRRNLEALEGRMNDKLLILYTGWGGANGTRVNFEYLDREHVRERVEMFLQHHYPDNWELSTNGVQYVYKGKNSTGADVIGWVDDRPSKKR